MIITLVRHGEVEAAYHHCYNGHNDIALSNKGREDAQQLSQILKDQTYDAIYSSDLKRCRETTEYLLSTVILAETGTTDQTISSPPHIHTSTPIPIYTSSLREKSWGKHEGMTFDAITKRDGLVYKDFLQWITTLDGEPYDSYISRVKTFFTQTLPLTPHNSVLVVTHAGVIRVLMHLLEEISLEEAFSIDFPYSAYTTLDTETWKFGDIKCV